MKALLEFVRARLESQISYASKIYIVTDPNEVVDEGRPPYLTIADRGQVDDQGKGSRIEALTVRVTAYQEIWQEEASVMGSGSKKGLIDMLDDAMTALRDYLPTGYHDCESHKRLPSEIAVAGTSFAARKGMDVTYEREITGE